MVGGGGRVLELVFEVAEDSGRQRCQSLQSKKKRDAWADGQGLEEPSLLSRRVSHRLAGGPNAQGNR